MDQVEDDAIEQGEDEKKDAAAEAIVSSSIRRVDALLAGIRAALTRATIDAGLAVQHELGSGGSHSQSTERIHSVARRYLRATVFMYFRVLASEFVLHCCAFLFFFIYVQNVTSKLPNEQNKIQQFLCNDIEIKGEI